MKRQELIVKSREAMLSAVQIYNNPQITFKSETYISLAVIAWTYLLHAYYANHGVDFRYYKEQGKRKVYDRTKHGAYKHWELERCFIMLQLSRQNQTMILMNQILVIHKLLGWPFKANPMQRLLQLLQALPDNSFHPV